MSVYEEKRGGIALITWLLEETFFFEEFVFDVVTSGQLLQFNQTSLLLSNIVDLLWILKFS